MQVQWHTIFIRIYYHHTGILLCLQNINVNIWKLAESLFYRETWKLFADMLLENCSQENSLRTIEFGIQFLVIPVPYSKREILHSFVFTLCAKRGGSKLLLFAFRGSRYSQTTFRLIANTLKCVEAFGNDLPCRAPATIIYIFNDNSLLFLNSRFKFRT